MLHQPDKVIKRYNAESTSHLSELGVLIVFFFVFFVLRVVKLFAKTI